MGQKYFPLASLLFIIQLQLLCLIHHPGPVSGLLEPYEVRIVNNLPDTFVPLQAICRSKDTNLGTHNIPQGKEFHWDFKMNVAESTSYNCDFTWPGPPDEKAHVNVFNSQLAYKFCGRNLIKRNLCYWSVTPEGFFLAKVLNPTPQQLTKIYEWPLPPHPDLGSAAAPPHV